MQEVDPGPHLDWWHVGKIIEAFQALADGEIKNLVVSAPPRTCKSRSLQDMASYRLRVEPRSKIFLTGANRRLMEYHGGNARGKAAKAGVKLAGDSQAKALWTTKEGGLFVSTTVKSLSSLVGWGWDIGMIDDPFGSIHDARNPRVQADVWDFFRHEFPTRRQSRPEGGQGSLLLMFQRLAVGDLADRLYDWLRETSAEEWHALILPGYARKTAYTLPSCCTLIADERQPGEPLCDDEDTMREIAARRRVDPALHAAVDQQDPQDDPPGGVFCGSWFRPIGADLGDRSIDAAVRILAQAGVIAPPSRVGRGWDLAAGGADALASARGSLCGDRFLWEDGTEAHPAAAQVERYVLDTARGDGTDVEQILPLEPAIGKIFAEQLAAKLRAEDFTVHLYPQQGPKRARSMAHAAMAAARCRACERLIVPTDAVPMFRTMGVCSCQSPAGDGWGNVDILARPFADRFRRHHHAFTGEPGGDDNLADASAACFNVLTESLREWRPAVY
jgi:hypothetical protein